MATTITTLSDLYCQDVPCGSVLIPQYPTSCDFYADGDPLNDFFRNDRKFNMFDHFKFPNGRTYKELIPQRIMSVAGPKLQVYADREPSPVLTRHWIKKMGPKTEVRFGELGVEKPHIVIFPIDRLREDLHSIDPNKHYHVFSKFFIPEIPCPQAKVLKRPEFPCVIKCAYGAGSEGTFMCYDSGDHEETIAFFEEREPEASVILTEMVGDIIGNYCCQFYLNKAGHVTWLGVTEQMMDDDGIWLGATVRSEKQDQLETLLKPTLVPVSKKLREWDYFGVVGVDILLDKYGKQFVIDINPRINGSTPMLLASRLMASKGWKDGIFLTETEFQGTEKELIEMAEKVKTGEVVIFSSAEHPDCVICHVGVFSTNLTSCHQIVLDLFKGQVLT